MAESAEERKLYPAIYREIDHRDSRLWRFGFATKRRHGAVGNHSYKFQSSVPTFPQFQTV